MSSVGMRRVYHFLNAKYGMQGLEKKRIKISTIMGVNDPFELMAYNLSDKSLRDLVTISKRVFHNQFGLLCFSQSSYSPVQWAHYGDRHTGLCLGFDVPSDRLENVIYKDVRVQDFALPIDELSQRDWIQNVLHTKYSQWSYEEEVRSFVGLETKEGEHFFKQFDEELVLKEVQVGFQSKLSRADIGKALGNALSGVDVFKVRPAFNSFQMVRNKNENLWK